MVPTKNQKNSQSLVVSLAISADEYLRYYRGSAKTVICYDAHGRRVAFPANILQKFVRHEGINGRFRIHFDSEGKFLRVEEL